MTGSEQPGGRARIARNLPRPLEKSGRVPGHAEVPGNLAERAPKRI